MGGTPQFTLEIAFCTRFVSKIGLGALEYFVSKIGVGALEYFVSKIGVGAPELYLYGSPSPRNQNS